METPICRCVIGRVLCTAYLTHLHTPPCRGGGVYALPAGFALPAVASGYLLRLRIHPKATTFTQHWLRDIPRGSTYQMLGDLPASTLFGLAIGRTWRATRAPASPKGCPQTDVSQGCELTPRVGRECPGGHPFILRVGKRQPFWLNPLSQNANRNSQC